VAGGQNSKVIYYGWYVVGVAFLANFMTTGTSFYVFNAFMLPLGEVRGWTRAEMNFAPMIGFACGLLGQFTFGTLVGRLGTRRLMALGPLLASSAFMLMGQTESLGLFYFWYVLLLLGNGALGGIVASTAVSNWFESRRGKALGLATAGMSLSGVFLPPLAGALLKTAGLEAAFALIACGLLVLSPLAWLVMRDSPESQGLALEGLHVPPPLDPREGAGESLDSATCGDEPLWTPRRLWASPCFWRLGTAYGLVMMGVMGVMFQLGPRFMDEGWAMEPALNLVAATALLATAGKYLWGLFCDRARPQKVVAVLMAGNAAGLGLGLCMGSVWGAAGFVLVFGFAMGGVMSTYPIITAHLFGRLSFPLVFRFLLMFMLLQAAGYLIMGQSFALFGSYDWAFVVFMALDLIAAAMVWSLPKPSPA